MAQEEDEEMKEDGMDKSALGVDSQIEDEKKS